MDHDRALADVFWDLEPLAESLRTFPCTFWGPSQIHTLVVSMQASTQNPDISAYLVYDQIFLYVSYSKIINSFMFPLFGVSYAFKMRDLLLSISGLFMHEAL